MIPINLIYIAYEKSVELFKHTSLVKQYYNRADSRLAASQWETLVQSNTISHWLGAKLKSALWSGFAVDILKMGSLDNMGCTGNMIIKDIVKQMCVHLESSVYFGGGDGINSNPDMMLWNGLVPNRHQMTTKW